MFIYAVRLESWAIYERLERRGVERDEEFKIILVTENSDVALIRTYLSVFEVGELLDVKSVEMVMSSDAYIRVRPETMIALVEELSKDKE